MDISINSKATNANNVSTRLCKNYDQVCDEIVVELMDITQKDLVFHGPTIMVQVLYALMEQVKMDHLSGGKCVSKRPQSKYKLLCTIMLFFSLAVDADLVGVCFPSICGVNNF